MPRNLAENCDDPTGMAAGQISAFGTRQGLVGLPLTAITVALTPEASRG